MTRVLRRIALAQLTAALALSCSADPVFHPGESDAARSREVREEVRACAEDRGWRLDNLKISVDAEGLLILIFYRSRAIAPRMLEREAGDTCLAQADVTQPPLGA